MKKSVAVPMDDFNRPKYSFYIPHKRVPAEIGGPSLTQQEFMDECDINNIMDRYEKTGVISHVARREPRYLDLSDVPDFQSAMAFMHDAEAAFMSLPARVRKEFDNDAGKFVEFAGDPANLDQMRSWGLAPPKPEPPPHDEPPAQAAPAAPPVAPAGKGSKAD